MKTQVMVDACSPDRCSAAGDWISPTGAEASASIAEVTDLDDRVEVTLEIHVGDLFAFLD